MQACRFNIIAETEMQINTGRSYNTRKLEEKFKIAGSLYCGCMGCMVCMVT
jgi:hypothetical protein